MVLFLDLVCLGVCVICGLYFFARFCLMISCFLVLFFVIPGILRFGDT